MEGLWGDPFAEPLTCIRTAAKPLSDHTFRPKPVVGVGFIMDGFQVAGEIASLKTISRWGLVITRFLKPELPLLSGKRTLTATC